MASDVSIINFAMLHLGLNPILSRKDKIPEANRADIIYDTVLKSTLRDMSPGFAKGQAALSLLDDTRDGWEFMYSLPSDYIEARYIYNPMKSLGSSYDDQDNSGSEKDIPYEIGTDSTGGKLVLLTNHAQAQLVYTRYITDANLYDSLFETALSLNLAAHLALPLKRDKVLRKDLLNEYATVRSSAVTKDANESRYVRDDRSSFSRARE